MGVLPEWVGLAINDTHAKLWSKSPGALGKPQHRQKDQEVERQTEVSCFVLSLAELLVHHR